MQGSWQQRTQYENLYPHIQVYDHRKTTQGTYNIQQSNCIEVGFWCSHDTQECKRKWAWSTTLNWKDLRVKWLIISYGRSLELVHVATQQRQSPWLRPVFTWFYLCPQTCACRVANGYSSPSINYPTVLTLDLLTERKTESGKRPLSQVFNWLPPTAHWLACKIC